jgi:RNA polymerase sigma-70 factor, ECF subfamily
LAEDLSFVRACLERHPEALAELHGLLQRELTADIARVQPDPAFRDEVLQTLEVRLVLGQDGGAPKLAEYSGRGPLLAWLRAVALGTALNLRRQNLRQLNADPDTELEEQLVAPDEPELANLRARCSSDFQQAFRAALKELTSEDRNILRLRFADGLNLDELAVYLNVHRATVARRLAGLKVDLLGRTRRLLGGRLGLPPEEVESLIRVGRSDFDLSVRSLMRSGSVERKV